MSTLETLFLLIVISALCVVVALVISRESGKYRRAAGRSRHNRGSNHVRSTALGRKAAGVAGETYFTALANEQGRKGRLTGHLYTSDLRLRENGRDQWFQLDQLMLVRNRGLLLVEVKNWSGDIRIERHGAQTAVHRINRAGQIEHMHCPIQQVQRSARLLRHLLERSDLTVAPVARAVVFVNPRCRLYSAEKLPVPVLTPNQFDRFIANIMARKPHRAGLDIQYWRRLKQALIAHSGRFPAAG